MFLDLHSDLVINHDRLSVDAYLGRGSFGSVYSGLLDRRCPVALKYMEPKDPGTATARPADVQAYKVSITMLNM